jgi:hypothetical protein
MPQLVMDLLHSLDPLLRVAMIYLIQCFLMLHAVLLTS